LTAPSKNKNTHIVDELAAKNSKIKHFRFLYDGPSAIALACHIRLGSYPLPVAVRWDGDFVAKSTSALMELKKQA
jgi:hypothetical protein